MQDTTCGIIWHEPVVIGNDIGIPHIAVQGDTLHVTWMAPWGDLRIPYKRSVNAGLEWDEVIDLWDYDTTRTNSERWIVADETAVYLVWRDLDLIVADEFPAWRVSYDRGTTWEPKQRITEIGDNFFTNVAMKNNILCLNINIPDLGGEPYILRIFQNGASWSLSDDSIYASNLTFGIAMTEGVLHTAYEVHLLNEVVYRKSYDLGDTWEDTKIISSSNGAADLPALAAETGNLYTSWRDTKYGCNPWGAGCSIIGRNSKNSGNTWLDEFLLSDIPTGVFSHPFIKGNVIAVAWSESHNDPILDRVKIRVSLDGGENWCPVKDFGFGTGTKVAVTTNALHVVYTNQDSEKVYYCRGEIITGVHENEEDIPQQIQLLQNYPNPFNPKTVISFKLSAVSNVSLKVYNILGSEVATLVNEKKEAGNYSVEWNAEKYTSGIYYYRLETSINGKPQTTITKKMLFIK